MLTYDNVFARLETDPWQGYVQVSGMYPNIHPDTHARLFCFPLSNIPAPLGTNSGR